MIITYKNGMQSYFLIILFVSLLSDFLDGIAARILDQKSELGKTLDPIADGITLFAFIILFNQEGLISTWFMIFYFLRQLTILIFSMTDVSNDCIINSSCALLHISHLSGIPLPKSLSVGARQKNGFNEFLITSLFL